MDIFDIEIDFESVIPMEEQQQRQRTIEYRLSTHSTRTQADHRFNIILFLYPIKRYSVQCLFLFFLYNKIKHFFLSLSNLTRNEADNKQ